MRTLNRRAFLRTMGMGGATLACGTLLGACATASSRRKRTHRPNIVYILADDMGYGDLTCLNAESKVPTPNMDRFAREGIIFTDAHSPSAVCTPTRYGVLTGRYPWRTPLKKGVLWGYSQHLIETGRMTAASLLKDSGYYTGCIGKWHLGWDWALKSGATEPKEETVDFTKPITNGPTSNGFDYCFCIPASLDMDPYVYLENDRCERPPTAKFPGSKGKAFMRAGLAQEAFKGVEVLPRLTEKASRFIDQRGQEAPEQPFFLYFPLPAPHTPIVPAKEFEGMSKAGVYGDFVCQVDSTVGQVMDALQRNGMAEDTLIILTSDNGCSPSARFEELAEMGHNPSYHFRGHKADIFEGGHRIPFLARWPRRIKAGSVTDETTCLTDFLATAAEIVGTDIPDNAAEDSYSMLPVLLGASGKKPIREATVHASIDGSLSIRQGKWKIELCPGSGGWSAPKPAKARKSDLPPVQLYDLSQDIGEKVNVQDKHPEVVERLTALLQKYVDEGRSTPGAPQKNEGPTSIWGPSGKKK